MKATLEKNVLTVTMEINAKPTLSASGKTLIVATTHGNQPTALTVNGKPVIIGLTAYVKA